MSQNIKKIPSPNPRKQWSVVRRENLKSQPVASKGELEFILAHELSHIKAHDVFYKRISIYIAYILLEFLFTLTSIHPDSLFAAAIESVMQMMAFAFITTKIIAHFCQKREKAADLSALSVCSPAGKTGAVTFFQKQIDLNKTLRANGDRRCTEDGNNLSDIVHPPLTERLAYAQQAAAQM